MRALFSFLGKKAREEAPASLAAALEPTPQRRECAWCNVVLAPGCEPVSHGICEPCAREFFPKQAEKLFTKEDAGCPRSSNG